ncbi:hypothetical protein C2S53_020350 [Perilla frutescens var. hirtella]|uniref:BSD domain-containing protein n=1 Tax=Perilla frutescens var. hirtella TaxID=608512 RepID=A0AAD4J6U1_PERFH|nr:hypothetical protein C2S53_020350 [Perilla frutescens var. hirtella]
MNFFKSIILDDPEPLKPESPHDSDPDSDVKQADEDRKPDGGAQGGDADGWSFGSLIKTLATRSESVIETYSRDLKEFGTGLRKETEVIREVASRAVKDLPASLEAGTSVAHGVLDGVLKSTAEIISLEPQVSASDGESETPEVNRSMNSGRYSRFEAQLSGIQSDLNTFCEEPEDVEEYEKWKSRFKLDEKRGEIDGLIGENGVLDAMFRKVVPNVVDQDTFWCRYFYRVDKLEQQEKVRANLVKRAISVDEDDDELSWDVDDEEEKDGEKAKGGDVAEEKGVSNRSSNLAEKGEIEKEGDNATVDDGVKNDLVKLNEKSGDGDAAMDEKETKSDEVAAVKSDEKSKPEEGIEGKNDENVGVDKGESREKGDVAAVSSHEVKTEEEDMGWDEIENIGSDDERKISSGSHGEKPNREELRKQLNAAEDDEDLSWDIEDDDEPVKS